MTEGNYTQPRFNGLALIDFGKSYLWVSSIESIRHSAYAVKRA